MNKIKPTTKKETSTFTAFKAEPEIARAMIKLQNRDGISLSEQMRRALKEFLTKKGVYTEKETKR